jgi:tRNA-Thr(GGU) m(6)t(6)A37 methyltransferase TsaA
VIGPMDRENRTKGFIVYPVGVVRTRYSPDKIKSLWQTGVEGYIEVYPEYKDGLKGIEGFSHLILIVWLHKRSDEGRKVLLVRHRKLQRAGVSVEELPEVGVFATDSPDRPNFIGISIVHVKRIEGNRIYVDNLDYYDGTPVLDIKPFTPELVPEEEIRVPDWYKKLVELAVEKTGLPRI